MFDFHEIVRITSSLNRPEAVGKEGYIAGKSFENDDHENGAVKGCAVYLFDLEEVDCFEIDEMVSLGRFINPHEEMSGEWVRVRNEDGRGVVVDEGE